MLTPAQLARAQLVCASAAAVPAGLTYGTAGFRGAHETLDGVSARMGALAALRSLQLGGLAVGIVVTASHNPVRDNGLKLVDADGGMLARAWEVHACRLAACTGADVGSVLAAVAAEAAAEAAAARASFPATGGAGGAQSPRAAVFIARDTRPSSGRLQDRVARGAAAVLGESDGEGHGEGVVDCGTLTTPQLHHIVRMRNQHPAVPPSLLRRALGPAPALAEADFHGEAGYYRMMRLAFVGLLDGDLSAVAPAAVRGSLLLDCANGIGGPQAAKLAAAMGTGEGQGPPTVPFPLVSFELRNSGATAAEQALLNEGVGAEHCQKDRKPPAGFSVAADAGRRCASLDGDADRLVYHYFPGDGVAGGADSGAAAPAAAAPWRLLDGDKIACLAAAFVGRLLTEAGLAVTGDPGPDVHGADAPVEADAHADVAGAEARLRNKPVSVGVVQTAYANGASRDYIVAPTGPAGAGGGLGLPSVPLAKTGVKYVHHAAASFDVGVYFEANGHGTVLFKASFVARLTAALRAGCGDGEGTAPRALRRLFWCTLLVNQAIGDALSDLLLVEAALALQRWSVYDWDAIYEDLPSVQSKIVVPDRSKVRVSADETRVLEPAELQQAIDVLVAAAPRGRAFVRPSGTEDLVRLYAEAADGAAAAALAAGVAAATCRVLL